MEKRGLGRGLSALIPEAPPVDSFSEVREIPIAQISANPFQPRTLFDPLKMEELVASVREHGVLQPVLLRRTGEESFELVAGERRFRAAQSAGLTVIPALIRDIDEREQLEIAVIENVQREDIGVMEAARAYRRLIDEFRMTQDTVSQRVGKSRSTIANTLRLLQLPDEVQDSVERNEISEGHARALLSAENDAAILYAWQTVVKKRLSVRDTEKLARDKRGYSAYSPIAGTRSADGKPNGSQSDGDGRNLQADPNEAEVANQLQEFLKTKVSLRHNAGGTGRIEIEFYSAPDLERIVDLLTIGRERD